MPVFDGRPTVPFTDQNVALVLLVLSSLGIIDVFYAILYVFHDLVVRRGSFTAASQSFLPGHFPIRMKVAI